MEIYKAKKIVIITEKVIMDGVVKIIEECGATGYTITAADGKGSRGVRSSSRAVLIEGLSNVKIEVITGKEETAHNIAVRVAEAYFKNYSGITYMMDVEILRRQKFEKTAL